ncbi:MAG TPA: ATP synthase F1 subunit epsilon [Candidatus Saccharimonadia bacterium]|jgi:F-type H+-transporting ATPase subunit epsilon
MRFELLTLTGTKFNGDATQVTLRTTDGDIGILPNHEPLTAAVAPGPVTVYKQGGQSEAFAVFGGLLEVSAERVRLLADEAEHAEELIANQIEAALKHAEDLKAAAKDKVELARAQELVDREVVRLGVAKMRRRHQR